MWYLEIRGGEITAEKCRFWEEIYLAFPCFSWLVSNNSHVWLCIYTIDICILVEECDICGYIEQSLHNALPHCPTSQARKLSHVTFLSFFRNIFPIYCQICPCPRSQVEIYLTFLSFFVIFSPYIFRFSPAADLSWRAISYICFCLLFSLIST